MPAPEAKGSEARAIKPVPSKLLHDGAVADETSEILSTAFGGCVPTEPSQMNEKTSRCVVPAMPVQGNDMDTDCQVDCELYVPPICPVVSCVAATGVVVVGTKNTCI